MRQRSVESSCVQFFKHNDGCVKKNRTLADLTQPHNAASEHAEPHCGAHLKMAAFPQVATVYGNPIYGSDLVFLAVFRKWAGFPDVSAGRNLNAIFRI